MSRTLVLGVGNPLRRDDGAGPAAARRLAGQVPEDVEVRELSGEAGDLLAAWEGRERVLVVDAVSSGAPAGTLRRIDAGAGPLPAALSSPSSHGLGVAQAVELARALGRLPPDLVLYAIEGEDFGPGEGLTAPVARGVEAAVAAILGELANASGGPGAAAPAPGADG